MDGLAEGGLSDDEANELVAAYSESTEVARNNIKTSISNASKDYDVDLSKALRFFGDAYLTLWMDVDIDMRTVDRDFLMNNLEYFH